MLRILILAIALVGCGKKEKPIEPVSASEQLREKFEIYKRSDFLKAANAANEKSTWLFKSCDATLFEGLRSIYQNGVNLMQARLNEGVWLRRSKGLGNCYEQRDRLGRRLSRSQISRDMLLGVAWWIYKNDRPDLAQEIVDYADSNGDVMGPGAPTRTGIGVVLKATFLKLAKMDRADSHYPVAVTGFESGFERHLAAWHLMLRSEIEGGLASGYHWWIEKQVKQQPQNPLFRMMKARFITGDYDPAAESLLNETYFPASRVPGTREFCDEWIIQRDMGDNWRPCVSKNKEWTGAAWLSVASWVIPKI